MNPIIRAPSRYKTISVSCACGQLMVRYQKGGKGRLQKLYKARISHDYTGIFQDDCSPIGTEIICPNCQKRFATIQIMSGNYVYKINQGQLGIIRKS